MDPDQLVKILKAQKEIAKNVSSRKGKLPADRAERHELLFKHQMQVSMRDMHSDNEPDNEPTIRTCITNASYPPSKTPASQLKPILLTDLRLETHHRGRIIFLRAIATAVRTIGVVTIVEDTNGAADRLSIYNASLASNPQSVLGKGKVYAVKDPYYKTSMDGGYSIRVDHPSDIMLLADDHNLMPQAFAPRLVELLSAEACKNQGNRHYKAKAYQLAVDSYSQGIEACTDDDQSMKADLYRNRSQANLLLGRFEHALSDANQSVELLSSGAGRASLNCKALYRAGRALYALRRFQEAEDMYERALNCSPSDNDTLQALDEVKMRIVEATTGVYDIDSIIAVNRTRRQRMNLASYVKDVAVRPAGERGRGLFAEKDFKTGDLIMVEKAFDISLFADQAAAYHLMIDINTDRGLSGTHSSLYYSLIQKLRHNSAQARQFLDLYSRKYTPKYDACEVDGRTVIDTFEVLAILQSNSFGTDSPDHTEHNGDVGIWLIASYMNHACDANTTRLFLGDMMLVRAARDIAKGGEIFTPYVGMDGGYADIQKSLYSTWSFKCSCAVCGAEGKTTAAQRDRRRARLLELTALIKANTHSHQLTVSRQITRQAEAIYTSLVETYDSALFNKTPRLDLVLLSLWIATSYNTRNDLVRAKPACLEVLRNCGVFVTIKKDKVTITREHGVVAKMYPVIDSAVHLMMIHKAEEKVGISSQFRSFAHSMWLLMHPSLKGFKERYDVD